MKAIVTTKTVKEVNKIENNFYIKRINLQPHEAEILLKKNVRVYEELIESDSGCCRKLYYCLVNIDALASVAEKQTGRG